LDRGRGCDINRAETLPMRRSGGRLETSPARRPRWPPIRLRWLPPMATPSSCSPASPRRSIRPLYKRLGLEGSQ